MSATEEPVFSATRTRPRRSTSRSHTSPRTTPANKKENKWYNLTKKMKLPGRKEGHSGGPGWSKLLEKFVKLDKIKIDDCKEDIDTLLVLAGLVSAVTGAFLIESYQMLSPDYSELSVKILIQISTQLSAFTVNPSFANSSQPAFTLPPFTPTSTSMRINVFWFVSLVLSLVTASVGILVKQWLHEFAAPGSVDAQECTRIRYFRSKGVEAWRVYEIASVLPFLLQFSIVLFFLGLCDFTRGLNPVVGWIVTACVILWLLAYVVTIVAPIFAANCPYKTPFLRPPFSIVRQTFGLSYAKNSDFETLNVEEFIRQTPNFDHLILDAADETFQLDEGILDIIRECLAKSGLESVMRSARRIITHRAFINPSQCPPDLEVDHDNPDTPFPDVYMDSPRDQITTIMRTMVDAFTFVNLLHCKDLNAIAPLVVSCLRMVVSYCPRDDAVLTCMGNILNYKETAKCFMQVLVHHPSSLHFHYSRFPTPKGCISSVRYIMAYVASLRSTLTSTPHFSLRDTEGPLIASLHSSSILNQSWDSSSASTSPRTRDNDNQKLQILASLSCTTLWLATSWTDQDLTENRPALHDLLQDLISAGDKVAGLSFLPRAVGKFDTYDPGESLLDFVLEHCRTINGRFSGYFPEGDIVHLVRLAKAQRF